MSISVADLLAVLGAVALAGIGGELFLKGVLGAAASLRVPKLLVATSLAAFATSSPELTVSMVAALAGKPEIGLGDALGSNVVNIALLFGLALLFGPIRVERKALGRDFALALGVPLLSFWFAANGVFTRGEGGLLLLIFALWVTLLIRAGMAWRESEAGTNGIGGGTGEPGRSARHRRALPAPADSGSRRSHRSRPRLHAACGLCRFRRGDRGHRTRGLITSTCHKGKDHVWRHGRNITHPSISANPNPKKAENEPDLPDSRR